MSVRRPRSYLVIPGIKVNHYLSHMVDDVNLSMWPDAIILDLEDSVPPHRKSEARNAILQILNEAPKIFPKHIQMIVRINPHATAFYNDDIVMLKECTSFNIGVALTKNESKKEILEWFMDKECSQFKTILPVIETIEGFKNRNEIFQECSCRGISRIVFGANDMALELGIESEPTLHLLRHVFCELIVSGRVASVDMVASPSRILPKSPNTDNWEASLLSECEWERSNGVVAKVAIHPSQIPIINKVFDYDTKVKKAKEIIETFEQNADLRSFVDGETERYLGTPMLKAARRVLGISETDEKEKHQKS